MNEPFDSLSYPVTENKTTDTSPRIDAIDDKILAVEYSLGSGLKTFAALIHFRNAISANTIVGMIKTKGNAVKGNLKSIKYPSFAAKIALNTVKRKKRLEQIKDIIEKFRAVFVGIGTCVLTGVIGGISVISPPHRSQNAEYGETSFPQCLQNILETPLR